MGGPRRAAGLLVLLALVAAAAAGAQRHPSASSRLSADFSSSIIVSPGNAPGPVVGRLDGLLKDMQADGVNSVCQGRHSKHMCANNTGSSCAFCLPAAAQASSPCSCAGANNTRCSCSGQVTGTQFFAAANKGLELTGVLVVAHGSTHKVDGGFNLNFNSTMQLKQGTKLFVSGNSRTAPGTGDLELDGSHLDLLEGSQAVFTDDADLEIEDGSTLWMAGGSSLVAKNASKFETRLAHLLVEGGSTVSLSEGSSWDVSQEWDMTPAQAAAICDRPFEKDAAAEWCFNNKEACKRRWSSLTNAQRQAVFMLKYPPALDQWGRQAFDYSDDAAYDDFYDADYEEPELESGACLSADVCGSDRTPSAGIHLSINLSLGRRLRSSSSSSSVGTPPVPLEVEHDQHQQHSTRSLLRVRHAKRRGYSVPNVTTEINPKDSADGKSYDPAFGEGPYGETLCDAPPHRSFNFYGLVVRGGSTVSISNSTLKLYDQSRAFVQHSTLVLENNATLQLMNSTLVLINSTLVLKAGSQISLQYGSSLQLFSSRVLGDSAMFALPKNSTWHGKPWVAPGDYRASPGGSLPAYMGAQPGVQVGTYPMRITGFGLEARMESPDGCDCKKPFNRATRVAAAVTGVPASADGGVVSALVGLL